MARPAMVRRWAVRSTSPVRTMVGARQRRRLHALRSHFSSCSATTGAAGRGTTEKQHDNDVPVYTVVLTGGPCGGKTSSQAQLSSTLADAGFDVYFAPEVPSILIRGGAAYPGLAPENSERLLVFEKGIIDLQLQVEESFLAVARSTGRPSVVVLDRGLLDIPAYLPRENWLQMLGKMGGMRRHPPQTRHFFLGRKNFYPQASAHFTVRHARLLEQDTLRNSSRRVTTSSSTWSVQPMARSRCMRRSSTTTPRGQRLRRKRVSLTTRSLLAGPFTRTICG